MPPSNKRKKQNFVLKKEKISGFITNAKKEKAGTLEAKTTRKHKQAALKKENTVDNPEAHL